MESPGKLTFLPALRAFEAAARLGGVSAAADELFVTHSAVSQQIKSLERTLGVRLFGRSGRNVVLTAAGQELALGANEAFCALSRTLSRVRQRANANRLTVTTLPSFAACWLTPRIGRFIELEPEVEINLISNPAILDFFRDGIDVAIRWGFGEYPGQETRLLMRDEFVVVASPTYLAQHAIASPADLATCTLLRAEDEWWVPWFARVGLDWQEPDKGLFFSDSALALRWAEDGRGVALARRTLADESLRSGAVVQLFEETLPIDRAYWFVTPGGIEPTLLLKRFRDWVFEEAQSMQVSVAVAGDEGKAMKASRRRSMC